MSSGMWPLYRVQQTDTRVMELEAQLAALAVDPNLQATMAETLTRIAAAEEQLRKESSQLKALEYELATREKHKKQIEEKLYSGKTTSSKELSGFQQEIEVLAKQKGDLEDQILGLMDEIDLHTQTIKEQQYLLGEQQKHVIEADQSIQAQRAEVQAALHDTQQKRAGLVADVEPDLLRKYDAMRLRKDGVAVTRALRGTCGVCGMALAPQSKTRLQSGQLETCKNCGRMLVGDET